MRSNPAKLIVGGACLLAPFLSILAFIVTGDLVFPLASLLCTTLISLTIIRFTLIEPRQGAFIAVTRIFWLGLLCATSVIASQSSFLWQLAHQFVRSYFPAISFPDTTGHEMTAIFIATAIIVATVLVAWRLIEKSDRDGGIVREASALSSSELEVIAKTVRDQLDILDQELRFFDFKSPTIDPKLEELSTTSRDVHIRTAYQVASGAANGDFIVVKGEPGSGKSVMLRSLARRLLGSVQSGGKVPLLLNMRDWQVPRDADQNAIASSLHDWVKLEYRRQTGSRLASIADEEFEQLYAEGSFVFLFDSFDENIAVTRSPHLGRFIGQLSKLLVEFVRASGGCVGLVFSREYKSPSAGWLSHRTYGVRPFADADIVTYISQNCTADKPLLKAIMGERRDLYAMAKTPLLLALLVDFSNANAGTLPKSEFEVFDSFVRRRLIRATTALNLPREATVEGVKAARLLARRHAGLVRISEPSAIGLNILREARLLRPSGAAEVFSHKRFQEYFRVCSMMDGAEPAPSISPGDIDENRDVLNLFAQICAPRRAKALARDAFANLEESFAAFERTGSGADYQATILGLRFLRNAFRNRPKLLNKYRAPIREIVVSLWNRLDVLNQKHAVEHLALLPPDTATSLVRNSLQGQFGFLKRVALAEARYVSSLQPWLGRCVAADCSRQDDIRYSAEHSRGDLSPPMTNAAFDDRMSMGLDIALRISLIVLLLACVFVDTPLIGTGAALVIMVIYTICADTRENSSSFDGIASMGFNAGVTGLFACNVMLAAIWNLVGSVFNPSKQFFWLKPGPAWLSFIALAASIAMIVNNFLLRRRDALNALGEIKPLSRAVLTLERPKRGATVAFIRRHWVVLSIFLAITAGQLTQEFAWAIVAVGVLWFLGLAIVMTMGILSRIKKTFAYHLDRPKVLKFSRHFAGMRQEIWDALHSVKTNVARKDILIAADAKSSEFARLLRDTRNEWPGGRRPKFDPSIDGYLAMADERWWGLG